MKPKVAVVSLGNESAGWDVRAWRVGLIGGNLSGLCLAGSFVATIRDFSMDVVGVLAIVSILVSLFVLPGILSGIARRRWMLWAYLPISLLVVWLFATVAAVMVFHVRKHHASSSSSGEVPRVLLIMLALPLSTSVPVCLARLALGRSRARQAARVAFEQSQFTIERASVWPPPPALEPTVTASDTEPSSNTKHT